MAGKVSGPGGGPPVGGPVDDQKSESPSGAGGPRFADKLAAGRIDAKAALDRVIERVVDKQIGPGAPAAVREKVRAALESAVADDPLLSEKIKSLGS